jgi:hypothetical protein
MAFLTIGPLTLKASAFRRQPDETGGALVPTLSGQLRGDPLWRRRAWTAEVVCVSDSEADSLYTYADGFTSTTVGGDSLGENVSCKVSVTDDTYQAIDDEWYRVLSLSIREAL